MAKITMIMHTADRAQFCRRLDQMPYGGNVTLQTVREQFAAHLKAAGEPDRDVAGFWIVPDEVVEEFEGDDAAFLLMVNDRGMHIGVLPAGIEPKKYGVPGSNKRRDWSEPAARHRPRQAETSKLVDRVSEMVEAERKLARG